MTTTRVTHADLVALAVRWLKTTRRCSVVLAEPPAMRGESPDAIGWRSGFSTLVECKVSRSDFKADQKKPHRLAGMRMARRCYYLTPPGLLRPDELPAEWGLLEARESGVRVVREVPREEWDDPRSADEVKLEVVMLWAELRRYHAQGITYQTITGRPAQRHLTAIFDDQAVAKDGEANALVTITVSGSESPAR